MSDVTTPQDQQLTITRVFDAPRQAVFEAWTDPDQVAEWFGPEGFDTPRERVAIDLRVGGRYELTMVQRDGDVEYPLRYEIVEIAPPRLLVLRCEPMPEVGLMKPTLTRVELDEDGAGTRMTLIDGPYVETRHAADGWHAAFAKLAALVAR